jgi:uncharacterized protein (TIGR00266 family)
MQAHEIDYEIIGKEMQAVVIELDPKETVIAEAGAMLYMEDGIEMETKAEGGLFGGLKRMISGESFFITNFTHNGSSQKSHVAFAAPYPGNIIPINLSEIGGEFLCQKDAFLCSAKGNEISVAFTKKLSAGFFGGEGFILQKLTGDGMVFVHAGGTIVEKDLRPGESLRLDTGCLVGFQPSVDYSIKFVGGFKNALFAGEGLFMANLRGPGKVYIQTLPFSRFADRLLASTSRMGNGSKGESRSGILGVLNTFMDD